MIELVRAEHTPEDLAREFEPSAQAICNWVLQAERDEGLRADELSTAEREELRRLRRKIRQVREERDILAKCYGLIRSGDGAGEVYRFMMAPPSPNSASPRWSPKFRSPHELALCSVSPARGYAGWRNREYSAQEQPDEVPYAQVREIHQRSRGTYGAPRVHAELASEGTPVIREAGLARG